MDHDKLLNLSTELGILLMRSGAEIYRVEESVTRLLQAYGQNGQVFAIPNCLIVSITTPDGHPMTKMSRITAHGTNIELLERCNELCRQICQNPLPVDQARALIDRLPLESPVLPPKALLLGYTVAAAFFALFFQGGPADFFSAALCGLAVGLCLLYGQSITGSNAFFRTLICAAVISAIALFCAKTIPGTNLEAISIGTLMLLVPGRALTNAMREIMAGDVMSGLNRTAEVILIGSAIAIGTAIPLLFAGRI